MEPEQCGLLPQNQGAESEQAVPQQETRLTSADAEREKANNEAANSKLMDTMEGSVETQGQWFVEVGEKKDITETNTQRSRGLFRSKTQEVQNVVGQEDTRVLVLNKPSETNQDGSTTYEYAVVTRDGLRKFSVTQNGSGYWSTEKEKKAVEVLDYLKAGRKPLIETGYQAGKFSGDLGVITLGYDKEKEHDPEEQERRMVQISLTGTVNKSSMLV